MSGRVLRLRYGRTRIARAVGHPAGPATIPRPGRAGRVRSGIVPRARGSCGSVREACGGGAFGQPAAGRQYTVWTR
jgi:hypothetical protein